MDALSGGHPRSIPGSHRRDGPFQNNVPRFLTIGVWPKLPQEHLVETEHRLLGMIQGHDSPTQPIHIDFAHANQWIRARS